MAHPVIWDPVVVIIMVAFITQAVFIVILLTGIGKVGAVILKGHKRIQSQGSSPWHG